MYMAKGRQKNISVYDQGSTKKTLVYMPRSEIFF